MPAPKKKSTKIPAEFRALIAASPSPALAEANFQGLIDASDSKSASKLSATDKPKLFCLLGSSAFLSDVLIREGKQWPSLFVRQVKAAQKSPAEHLRKLEAAIKKSQSFDEFCAALRRHKQREYLRIGARDLMPEVSMEETVRELTALASASVDAAYRFCRAEAEKDYGPLHLPGTIRPNRFVVLGMGKLGGGELNFSSDIDVIYLYEEDEGETSGGRRGKTGPREFFSAIGQKIIHAMGDVTDEGFVFRIDLRLRPLGANGPLVQSVNSAMTYYESWGQCWERAALIKARPVAGDIELGAAFMKDIEPFIYRRYLDYTTVDELRHMKMRIENELLTGDGKERNLKLGYGGIREIEFFTQALQLVNGGYQPTVRGPSTLPALVELARNNLISADERDKLTEAYRFLRQAEHKVQIVQEAHAHSIPEGKEEEQAYARRLGYSARGKLSERELFWRDHKRTTKTVREIFDRLFYSAQKEIQNDGATEVGTIWNDLDQKDLIVKELEQAGFTDPAQAYENLLAVRDGEVYAPPSPRRLKVMRTLGPALMAEIAKSGAPDQALLNLSKFSHRIGSRTGFLTLLAENPKTMRLLITLFSDSQFLTDLFLNRPELIDTLIRVDLTRVEKTKEEMLAELNAAIGEADDVEAKLNALRRYKSEEFVRIGLHDLGGVIELVPVLQQLSDLAEACVHAALNLTLEELQQNFGKVAAGRFAIIGGGKLGAREIDYNSDLDLVFIYDAEEDAGSAGGKRGKLPAHEFFVRLGQKLLTYLSSPTEEGIAYKIDMQLRPSGKAGPIVCSLEAYRDYHKSGAQLWERQALIKTRFIAGDATLGKQVDKFIENLAYGLPLPAGGADEIHHLRMRMERELADEDEGRFNLKKGRGGLVDIEFLTQMLQLAHGHRFAALHRRATLDALAALQAQKLISKADYLLLSEGYLFLRRLDHRLRIERDRSIDTFEAEPGKLDGIARALGYKVSNKATGKRKSLSGEKLLGDYRVRRDRVRLCYERLFSQAAK
ncbi:MAG: bifunctional [glutamate--ammonia ligase]-adenylyl-L-tyrosine phosphorylase/[glutamate--ammonia-ligase] adenylyltransferase [Deltaproteobacteria bacterium]|nr:bifunctional [glutamate--ammonia ligase]-adenylyl-L-tyrosine phosphorylase/[glutamate--ammonia-ligase] adenylyltransferase [Deltaproteobacteria bacterium]